MEALQAHLRQLYPDLTDGNHVTVVHFELEPGRLFALDVFLNLEEPFCEGGVPSIPHVEVGVLAVVIIMLRGRHRSSLTNSRMRMNAVVLASALRVVLEVPGERSSSAAVLKFASNSACCARNRVIQKITCPASRSV